MIIDKRIQKRKITIDLSLVGGIEDLDEFVDIVLKDLKIILKQRELGEIKIDVIVE
jgi:hypothetical protein